MHVRGPNARSFVHGRFRRTAVLKVTRSRGVVRTPGFPGGRAQSITYVGTQGTKPSMAEGEDAGTLMDPGVALQHLLQDGVSVSARGEWGNDRWTSCKICAKGLPRDALA